MESTNGGSVEVTEVGADLIAETLAPLAERRGDLLIEREQIKNWLDEKDAEIRKVDKILRAGGVLAVPEPKQRRPVSNKGAGNAGFGSRTMLERVRAATAKLNTDAFTIRQVADEAGVRDTTAKKALEGLRAEGVVRLVGKRRASYGHGPAATHYAVIASD